VMNLIAPESFSEQLRKVGFHNRPAVDKVLILPTVLWTEQPENLTDKSWYITSADRDV